MKGSFNAPFFYAKHTLISTQKKQCTNWNFLRSKA